MDEGVKVRVLLAQALFGNPDILLLDEPTNGLDLSSITWLEEFLIEFPNIVIVVSHDRHFLNAVCTHTCDIDFGQVRMYAGNYDFWFHLNRVLAQQQKDEKKRREEKVKDLKEFIQRFAANVSKSRQATSRKKILEKLEVDDYVPSSRRFPYVGFKPSRSVGNVVLEIEGAFEDPRRAAASSTPWTSSCGRGTRSPSSATSTSPRPPCSGSWPVKTRRTRARSRGARPSSGPISRRRTPTCSTPTSAWWTGSRSTAPTTTRHSCGPSSAACFSPATKG